jgi:hypothetical protein
VVRAQYVEGLPYAEARKLKPAGVERLIEMLQDPGEAAHHSNIVMALGISEAPPAYPASLEFQDREVEGEVNGTRYGSARGRHRARGDGGREVDSAEYDARRAIPLAMGHLARTDSRAFEFLLDAAHAQGPESAPLWTYRHLREERLAGILRRAAITGVAMSGRPEAKAALRDLEERVRVDPEATEELYTHVREAQTLCDRVMREGPDWVFGSGVSP